MAEEPLRANLNQQGQSTNGHHLSRILLIIVVAFVSAAITYKIMVAGYQDKPQQKDVVTYEDQPQDKNIDDFENFMNAFFMQVNPAMSKPFIELKWSSSNFPPLPIKMYQAQAVYIDGTVCFGGGKASDDIQAISDEYYVYCFDKTKRKWVKLGGQLPVRYFGLGKVNGKIIATGGVKKNDEQSSTTYIHDGSDWVESSSLSMLLPRRFPGVSSSQSGVIIVGGHINEEDSKIIEIYRSDLDQWLLANLPVPCVTASTATLDDIIFIVCNGHQPLYADISAVISKGVPKFDKRIGGSGVWKVLRETPSFNPIPVIHLQNLYVLGGRAGSEEGKIEKKVYSMPIVMEQMFSSLDKFDHLNFGFGNYSPPWMYAGDLPEPLTDSCVVPSTLFAMLLGGKANGIGRTNKVHIGQQSSMLIYMRTLHSKNVDSLIFEHL